MINVLLGFFTPEAIKRYGVTLLFFILLIFSMYKNLSLTNNQTSILKDHKTTIDAMTEKHNETLSTLVMTHANVINQLVLKHSQELSESTNRRLEESYSLKHSVDGFKKTVDDLATIMLELVELQKLNQ